MMKSTKIVDRRELERLVKRAGGRCSKGMSDAALAREAARCGVGSAKVIKPKKKNPRQPATILDPGGISFTGPFGVFGSREWMRAPRASNPSKEWHRGRKEGRAWGEREVARRGIQQALITLNILAEDARGRTTPDRKKGLARGFDEGLQEAAAAMRGENPLGDYLNISNGGGAAKNPHRATYGGYLHESDESAWQGRVVYAVRGQEVEGPIPGLSVDRTGHYRWMWDRTWGWSLVPGHGRRKKSKKNPMGDYLNIAAHAAEAARASNPLGDYLNIDAPPPVGRPWKPGRSRAEGFPTAFKEARARAGRQLQKAVKALDEASKGAKAAAAKKSNPGLAIIGNPGRRLPGGRRESIDDIQRGDRVTIVTAQGQRRTGVAALLGPAGWVLNMGRGGAQVAVANENNIVGVKHGRANPPRRRNSPFQIGDSVQSLLTGEKGRVSGVAREVVVRWDSGDQSSEKPRELVHCDPSCHTHRDFENPPRRGRRGMIRPGDIV